MKPYFIFDPLIEFSIYFFSGEGYYANQDDDFIFEDFARLRLKGHEGDDTEAWALCQHFHILMYKKRAHLVLYIQAVMEGNNSIIQTWILSAVYPTFWAFL